MASRQKIFGVMGAVLLSFAASGTAWAADYYMSPSGNDSNAGTLAAPWKTMDRLQQAQKILKPGDTVYFRGGDYVSTPFKVSYYTWNADGTSSAPITYKNYNGETPTIVYTPNHNPPDSGKPRIPPALYLSADYLVVDGINFRLPEEIRRWTYVDGKDVGENGRQSRESVGAIGFYGTGSILRNCHIDNFSQTAMYVGGSNILVEYCKMTNNVSYGLYISSKNSTYRFNVMDGSRGYEGHRGFQIQYYKSQGNKVYGNLVMNSQVSGATFSGRASYNEVFNNVFINPALRGPAAGQAVDAFCEDGILGPGNKFYNNTIIGKSGYALFIPSQCKTGLTKCNFHNATAEKPMTQAECQAELASGRPNLAHVEIYNNIFYPTPGTRVGATLPNIRNNIFFNATGSLPANNTLADPKLANPTGTTALDAMLTDGSPAIDKATGGAPSFDYQNGKRPFGAASDIGAFEFGAPAGSGGPISLPPGISVPSTPVFLSPTGEICPSPYL